MSRETYVWRDGQLIMKSEAPPVRGVFHVMPDIAPFVTVEGVPISSRSELRAYEQKNGVKQVGSDWTGSAKPAFWDKLNRS